MNDEQTLDDIKKLIDSGKLGEIPSLDGKSFKEVSEALLADKEKFAVMLSMLAVFAEGKYIRLFGDFAKESIKNKIEKKAYLPNITLDILFWLEMIQYLEVKENSIVIKILDDNLANELSIVKSKLKEQKTELNSVEEYYKKLKEFELFKSKYTNN